MNEKMLEIKALIEDLDSANQGGATKYSTKQLEGTLREQLIALFGTANPSSKTINRNPNAGMFFEILEREIDTKVNDILEVTMPFMEIIDIGWGDKYTFEVENPDLFDVYTIAKGNGDISRQRIENGYVTVDTDAKGIKIFDNFKRFLAGRVDWAKMIERVAQSYATHIRELVWTAFYAVAPVNGNSTFNVNDAGGFDLANVYTLVDHVQAENLGTEVVIIGTRSALKNLAPTVATDEANRDMYENGYYRTAEGYNLIMVDAMHVKNTFDFLLSNKQLMVVPADLDGLVKVVNEGEAYISNTPFGVNKDMSVEYMYYRETGVAVVTGARFGKYTWV